MKRLIDLDRQVGLRPKAALGWQTRYGFLDVRPSGPGGENAYDLVDAVALWMGLQLLDAGLPQKEIVEFLRELRPQLRNAVLKVVAERLDVISAAAQERRGPPAERLRSGRQLGPDDYVYVVTESVTASGVTAVAPRASNLCWGRDALVSFIEATSQRSRRFVVLEIANAIVSLAYLLLISEPAKRGRAARN